MKQEKETLRFALQKVEVLSVLEQGRPRTQAKVVLARGDQRFTGRVFVPPDDEEMLRSIALATIEALRVALPEGACFFLKSVTKMYPKFLADPIFVVLLSCHYEDLDLDLTGACISSEEKVALGVANATLDATNRMVSFLLDSIMTMDDGINDF